MTPLVRVLEFVGESKQSFEDAVRNAVEQAARQHPNITGVEIYNFTGDVVNGKIVDFKANVKVACVYEQE
ncbi:MAG TPA: dodecin domain-containing protein [Firmicutes bacterium]|jgi:flavin-binding protein dodecin|nr:dodecin domain-containing protein [Bacillota bacterium]